MATKVLQMCNMKSFRPLKRRAVTAISMGMVDAICHIALVSRSFFLRISW